MRQGRNGVLAAAGLLLAVGSAAAQPGGWHSRIYLGPPRNPNTVATTDGGIPGARGLAPGYGYYPEYSSNWPTFREALAQYGVCGSRAGTATAPAIGVAPGGPIGQPGGGLVRVPADAEVWIAGRLLTERGESRSFATPPLAEGQFLSVEVLAHWQEGGRDYYRGRRVRIHPGDRVSIDLREAPEPEVPVLPPPRMLDRP